MRKYYDLDDVQSQLLKKGIVDLVGSVDKRMAAYVRECIMRLTAQDSPDIILLITSNGGETKSGLEIYDMLRLYPGRKYGKVMGAACSMAAIILQACDKRSCAKHATIMIHNVMIAESVSLNSVRSKKEMRVIHKDLEKDQRLFDAILAKRTGKTRQAVQRACRKEKDMTAREALAFGLIDKII